MMKVITLVRLATCLALLGALGVCTPEERAQIFDALGLTPSSNNLPAANPGSAGSTDPSSGASDPGPNPGTDREIRLTAVLVGPGPAHGEAEFRRDDTRRRLKIELEDAVPGSTHMIVIDGVDAGELTIGPLGEREVEFDTKVEDEHRPWPSGVSQELTVGIRIDVGSTTGVLGNE